MTWPWGGKEVQPSVFDSAEKWAKMTGCSPHAKTVADTDGVKAISYCLEKGDAEVLLYMVEGMGHTWPGARMSLPEHVFGKSTEKLRACDTIWDFFQRHKRNDDESGRNFL